MKYKILKNIKKNFRYNFPKFNDKIILIKYILNIYIHTNNDIMVSSFLYRLLNSARAACNSKRIKPRIRFSAETKDTNYLSILMIFYISNICICKLMIHSAKNMKQE